MSSGIYFTIEYTISERSLTPILDISEEHHIGITDIVLDIDSIAARNPDYNTFDIIAGASNTLNIPLLGFQVIPSVITYTFNETSFLLNDVA